VVTVEPLVDSLLKVKITPAAAMQRAPKESKNLRKSEKKAATE